MYGAGGERATRAGEGQRRGRARRNEGGPIVGARSRTASPMSDPHPDAPASDAAPGPDAPITRRSRGRRGARLFATPYAQYERALRAQMVRHVSAAGFDPRRDVAGIVLNRWGHARVLQPPGWFYGRDGRPAPREVVAAGFGRVAIAHAELNGHQSATGAMAQGKRAGEWAASSRRRRRTVAM